MTREPREPKYHIDSTSNVSLLATSDVPIIIELTLPASFLEKSRGTITPRLRGPRWLLLYTATASAMATHHEERPELEDHAGSLGSVKDAYLCSHCQIVFPKLKVALLSTNLNAEPTRIARYVNMASYLAPELTASQSCDLCNLVLSILATAHNMSPRVVQAVGFTLWAVDLLDGEERSRATYYPKGHYLAGIYARLGASSEWEVEKQDMLSRYRQYRRNGLIMPLTRSEIEAREIDRRCAAVSTAKEWIRQCQMEHGNRCNQGTTLKETAVDGLKVIDCEKELVVGHEGDGSYLALSYVWGRTEGSRTDTSLALAPGVVRDAMELTRKLGYKFLWVDRYYIDQSNHDEVLSQVGRMDVIYENATMTIVAASGEDDNYGLPGVGTGDSSLRTAQPATSIDGLTLISSLPEVTHCVERSKWATRGWTYQEALLSKRCLLFFPSQMFFACRTMCRSETLPNLPSLQGDVSHSVNLQTLFLPAGPRADPTRYLARTFMTIRCANT